MAKSNLALAGGDPRVVAHPSFRKVPECQFPLKSKEAKAKYGELARMIFEAGGMTTQRHLQLSSYCLQFDAVTLRAKKGEPVRPAAFIQMDKALKALKLDEIDKPLGAPQGTQANKYARSGFAGRRR